MDPLSHQKALEGTMTHCQSFGLMSSKWHFTSRLTSGLL